MSESFRQCKHCGLSYTNQMACNCMLYPPIKPEREQYNRCSYGEEIYDGVSLKDLISRVGQNIDSAFIKIESNWGDTEVYLKWFDKDYQDKIYNEQLKEYNKRLAKYNTWHEQNKELIQEKEKEKIRIEQDKKKQQIKFHENQIKKLKKEM